MGSMILRTKLPLLKRLGLRILNMFRKGHLRVETNPRQIRNPKKCLLQGHRSRRLPPPRPFDRHNRPRRPRLLLRKQQRHRTLTREGAI